MIVDKINTTSIVLTNCEAMELWKILNDYICIVRESGYNGRDKEIKFVEAIMIEIDEE